MRTSPSTACCPGRRRADPRAGGLLADGTLRPVISHELPLSAAAEAHRILEGRHAGGKVVLDVAGS